VTGHAVTGHRQQLPRARPPRPEVSPAQLSVLRMVPIARRLARAGRGRVTVLRLLNSHRGWDTTHTPVDDVVWALAQVREAYGELPVGLVGHSVGGRAALLAGDRPGVRSVVALNQWVYPTDRVDLAGRRVLVVHGTADRVADIDRVRAVVAAISRTTDVEMVEVEGGKHAMLSQAGRFERPATAFTLAALSASRPPR
jgi:pimeloyl-ACP methyl ester carboxylesterase